MATLKKLSISGIRSYSPHDDISISFTSPLTLFLGQNGCGKTTILEAIKFGLTGEVPGGTNSGQGFVNDPSMTGLRSTKGTIKLKFADSKGNTVLVGRFMTVTLKNDGSLTYKSDQPHLRLTSKDNVVRDITGRCADINLFCSDSLNISEAIINNVAFCHQENSSWPLEEPKKLKKKFDAIFDAVKYNNFVDSLRKHVNELRVEIKIDNAEVENKNMKRMYVDRERQKLAEREEKVAKQSEAIEAKVEELKPLDDRMNEILSVLKDINSLEASLKAKEASKKGLQAQQKIISDRIDELLSDSDEELNRKIGSFDEDNKKRAADLSNLEEQKIKCEVAIRDNNDSMQKTQLQIGKLKQVVEVFDTRCKKRRDLIEMLKIKLKLSDIGDVSDLNERAKLLELLTNKISELHDEFECLQLETQESEREIQKSEDTWRENCATIKQNLTSKKVTLKELDVKLKEITHKIQSLSESNSQAESLERKLQDCNKNVESLQKNFQEQTKLREIEEIRTQIRNEEAKLDRLEKDYKILSQNSIIEDKIEGESQTIKERHSQLDYIKERHLADLNAIFNNSIPTTNLSAAISNILKREELKVRELTEKITKTQKQSTINESRIDHQTERIAQSELDIQNGERQIFKLTNGKNFDTIMEESYAKNEELQKNKGQYNSSKIMYEKFIEQFQKPKACCPVCSTSFNERQATQLIIQRLKSQIIQIPEQLSKVEAELKTAEEFYNQLQQIKPTNDKILVLKEAQLPLYKEELSELQAKQAQLSVELAASVTQCGLHKHRAQLCSATVTDATLYDQYKLDIEKATKNVEVYKRQLVEIDTTSTKQETESDIDNVKAAISELRGRSDNQKRLLDSHRDRLQRLIGEKQRMLDEQERFRNDLLERPLWEQQKCEFIEKMADIKLEIEEITLEFSKAELNLREANAKKVKIVADNIYTLKAERVKLASNQKLFDELEKVHDEIDVFYKNDTQANFDKATAELKRLVNNEEALTKSKNQVIKTIANKREAAIRNDAILQNYRDNILLRAKKSEETTLDGEIAALRLKIGNQDYRSIHEQREAIESQKCKIQREIDGIRGQIGELNEAIREIEATLAKPEHKYAHDNHKRACYSLALKKMEMSSLTTLAACVDKAVLKFHKDRMMDVNKIIRELWRTTYKGNDIDYIEIKTEMGKKAGTRAAYDYRVIQVKNEVEMEMRGRCSAGQKVLACLIIRLALADTFSMSCGILALDEPTTNLDRENILSLSETLSELIQRRDKVSSFQLLIITHDEEFLTILKRNLGLMHYYKVDRNDAGFSTVEKVTM